MATTTSQDQYARDFITQYDNLYKALQRLVDKAEKEKSKWEASGMPSMVKARIVAAKQMLKYF